MLAKFLRIYVCFQQQKSTFMLWKDKTCLRAESHSASTEPHASWQQAAASFVTSHCHSATALGAIPCPPALLSVLSPGWGDMKAAHCTDYPSTREALLKISVLFFFFF